MGSLPTRGEQSRTAMSLSNGLPLRKIGIVKKFRITNYEIKEICDNQRDQWLLFFAPYLH
jgi:hypothetical protein